MGASVYFFGGYKASVTDVKVWAATAKAQRSDAEFYPFPWPHGADAGAASAVATATNNGQFGTAVEAIKGSSAETIYIVGHSSGCAIANAVDRSLEDHDNVVLVALDGFAPNRAQLARPNTQVWAAMCGSAKSRNYGALKGLLGGALKVYEASDCKTAWALHFSLVNADARDATVTSIAEGYAQCWANLCWM